MSDMDEFVVETPAGTGRWALSMPDSPRALLALGHGSGGGIEALDLVALASGLPGRGIAVARFEQPWRVAGKKVGAPPASLDKAWTPALESLLGRVPGVPLFVGGRSAGARVACRCFAAPALGVVALSFPLHPPGRPEKSRVEELAAVAAPALCVSGDRDTFGSPAELEAALAAGHAGPRELVIVPGSGHSFRARKRLAGGEVGTEQQIVDAVARFVDGLAPSTILRSGKWPQPTKVALLAAPAVPLGSPVATTVATASLPRRWSG